MWLFSLLREAAPRLPSESQALFPPPCPVGQPLRLGDLAPDLDESPEILFGRPRDLRLAAAEEELEVEVPSDALEFLQLDPQALVRNMEEGPPRCAATTSGRPPTRRAGAQAPSPEPLQRGRRALAWFLYVRSCPTIEILAPVSVVMMGLAKETRMV